MTSYVVTFQECEDGPPCARVFDSYGEAVIGRALLSETVWDLSPVMASFMVPCDTGSVGLHFDTDHRRYSI